MNAWLPKGTTTLVFLVVVIVFAFSFSGALTGGNEAVLTANGTTPSTVIGQSTFSLTGSAPFIPSNAVNLGPALPTQLVTVYLGLAVQNQSTLTNLIEQISSPGSPLYRHYLSHSQFVNEFEPGPSVYGSIANYYKSQGFSITPSGDRLYIALQGNIGLLESVFGISIDNFQTSLGTYYFATTSPNIPSGFSSEIASIIGLSNYPYFTPALTLNPASGTSVSQYTSLSNNGFGGAASPQPPYTPYALYEAFNATGVYDAGYQGQYETIAVTDAYGDPTAAQDLVAYSALYNVSLTSSFQTIYPEGQPSTASVSSLYGQVVDTWEIESALDNEMSHAFAPAANIVSVISPDAGYTLVQALVYVIVNNLANVVSNSWGESELQAGVSLTYLHPFLEMAATEGITVLASSGDNGSTGYDSAVPISATWPSDDPYMTSVGGTTVFMNGTVSTVQNPLNGPPTVTEVFNPIAMINETAWDGYTGGGYSQLFPRPFWQTGNGLPTSGQYSSERGFPDVAAVGMFGGNDFVFNGLTAGSYAFGGTSFASPQWAGIVATIDSYTSFIEGSQIGFINPTLYSILNSPVYNSSFYDVKYGFNGANGQFNAGPGWDPTTGLGSPNIGFLAREFAEYDFTAGVIGDANSTNNTGASASIQTIVPDRTIGTSSDFFQVSETLSDGTQLFTGVAVSNTYPSGSAFYGLIPSASQFGTEFVTYIGDGSAGTNGTFNDYSISETSPNVWTFLLNGKVISSISYAATSSGNNAPRFEGLAQGVTSVYNTLGPAVLKSMEFRNTTSFLSIPSVRTFEQTNLYSSYDPPYFFSNPYGVESYGNQSIRVGTGIPYSNNSVLYGKFYNVTPTTVFLQSPQYVTLYAQNVSETATAGTTSFPLSTAFPTGQADFNSFYLVPVAGVSTWNFVLKQPLDENLYVSQMMPSYLHFYVSLESVSNQSSAAGVPVTVQVTAHGGASTLGTSSETQDLPLTGSVVEYNLSFLSQVGMIQSSDFITFSVSWYTLETAGEHLGYAVVLHSGQNYPQSLSLPVYNPVDESPLAVTNGANYVSISSKISSPFGIYDLASVVGSLDGVKYTPVIAGTLYTWNISTSNLPAGTYNFTVFAYDLQGKYNFNQTSFTVSQTITIPPPPPPPHHPHRPPKPHSIGKPDDN